MLKHTTPELTIYVYVFIDICLALITWALAVVVSAMKDLGFRLSSRSVWTTWGTGVGGVGGWGVC